VLRSLQNLHHAFVSEISVYKSRPAAEIDGQHVGKSPFVRKLANHAL
jgi:hypothetical protein